MADLAKRSGLRRFYDGVAAYFAANEVPARLDFGVLALARQDNQGLGRAARVVIVPFDPASGDGGRISQPIMAGEQDIPSDDDPELRSGAVRAIGDWERNMLVSVWGYDANEPRSELAHAVVVENLVEWTKRAVDTAAGANVEWGATKWIVPREQFFGLEVRIGMRVTIPLFDLPMDVGFPGLRVLRPGESE